LIGPDKLAVWFNTKPVALVGQEIIMFGGLATTFNHGNWPVLIARTPAESACEPLAEGTMLTASPLAELTLLTV
jgi:hypothetical protein